jgi:hypothetical protein
MFRTCKITGLVECWFTHPFLDEFEKWDLSNKQILEFGAGQGTAWLRKRSKWVDTIEGNQQWVQNVKAICENTSNHNGEIFHIELDETTYINESLSNMGNEFFNLIPKKEYDIISVDGIFRDECLKWALNHFKNKSGIIIADNWQQDYVWISEQAKELMGKYEENRFVQPDHVVHEGKPWNTTYWKIN